MINENLSPISCLGCRNTVDPTRDDRAWTCPSCGFLYPLFDGRIPVLLKEPRKNFAASWLEHRKHISDNNDRLSEVKDALGRQPHRSDLLNRAVHAYEHDNPYLGNLQAKIAAALPESEIKELEEEGKLPRQYTLGEGIAFYPRDWCWSDRAEGEIETITSTISGHIDAYADDVDSVLIPGAGAGRFAGELARIYDNCFAFDYSLHMIQIFYDLLLSDMKLHRVNLRSNVVKTEDVVTEYSLSLGPLRSEIDSSGFAYFVGNALDVPLPGNSLSAVACIYFIDIIPVREQMLEARRLLKPGGLFINFGPLRYMRGDVANMLSGEEILDLYASSGFDILAHDVVPNTQLASAPVITSVHSNNFTFVARKR